MGAAPGTLPLTDDIADTLADLDGLAWIPGVDLILRGIHQAATAELTREQTQTLLTLIGNPSGPDLTQLLALLVQHLTHPATNPCLLELDAAKQNTVQELGKIHAFETAELAPRAHTNEAAGLIDGA